MLQLTPVTPPPLKNCTANLLHLLIGLGEGKMAVHWHHIVGEVHVAGVSRQNRLVQSCGGNISPVNNRVLTRIHSLGVNCNLD